MKAFEVIVWLAVSLQIVAWFYFSYKGGELTNKKFYLFTFGMMIGQLAAGVETYLATAWGTFAVQVFFFLSTGYAGIQRYRKVKKNKP
jgi:hypothetical protein